RGGRLPGLLPLPAGGAWGTVPPLVLSHEVPMTRPISAAATLLLGAALMSAQPVFQNAAKPPQAPPGGASGTAPSIDELREQVRRAEIAFAKTMADPHHNSFTSFLPAAPTFL